MVLSFYVDTFKVLFLVCTLFFFLFSFLNVSWEGCAHLVLLTFDLCMQSCRGSVLRSNSFRFLMFVHCAKLCFVWKRWWWNSCHCFSCNIRLIRTIKRFLYFMLICMMVIYSPDSLSLHVLSSRLTLSLSLSSSLSTCPLFPFCGVAGLQASNQQKGQSIFFFFWQQ